MTARLDHAALADSPGPGDRYPTARESRLAVGATVAEIAALIRVSAGTYCGYESGRKRVPFMHAERLATVLGTSSTALAKNYKGGGPKKNRNGR